MSAIRTIRSPFGLLLNKADFTMPEDGWIHACPTGERAHNGLGIVEVFDTPALDAMVAAFKAEAASPTFPGLLVDFDHGSVYYDQSSEAAGWIEDMVRRDDGLWCKVRWTDAGKAAVTGGNFRLVSPVFCFDDMEELGPDRYRPKRLDSLALTNNPNLKDMTPITNREDFGLKPNPADAGSPKSKDMPPQITLNRDDVVAALGLQADAADAAVQERALAVLNSAKATAALRKTAGLESLTEADLIAKVVNSDTVAKERDELRKEAVLNRMEEFKDVIADRAVIEAALNRDFTGASAMLRALKSATKPAEGQPPQRVHNSATAGQPGSVLNQGKTGDADASRASKAQSDAVANRAVQLSRDKGIDFAQAFRLAAAESVSASK